MKSGHFFVVLLLSVLCLILTVALIIIANTNQKLQVKLQLQQQALNQGILGQQAQQISAGVLQDLADLSVKNSAVRLLLEKHGYRITPRPQTSETNLPDKVQPDKKQGEPAKTENTEAAKP